METTSQAMTREEMAVAVAKDVLKQLRRRKGGLNMRTGVYVSGMLDSNIPGGEDLQPHVDRVQANCRVCQLGAVLLSKARLFDKVDAEVLWMGGSNVVSAGGNTTRASLRDVFSEETIGLMECAFEQASHVNMEWATYEARRAARDFGNRFDDSKSRARAIMKNVVANGGEFRP